MHEFNVNRPLLKPEDEIKIKRCRHWCLWSTVIPSSTNKCFQECMKDDKFFLDDEIKEELRKRLNKN